MSGRTNATRSPVVQFWFSRRTATRLSSASSLKIGERSETPPCSFISSSPGFWLPSSWPRRCPMCSGLAAAISVPERSSQTRPDSPGRDQAQGEDALHPGASLSDRAGQPTSHVVYIFERCETTPHSNGVRRSRYRNPRVLVALSFYS